ncbi:MAG TPA: biotin/lipoyl-containing protein, partial [Rhizomicrobium sp.]|nr:biotin/lipoyl-containing protein [Rhizomicrobium sp.]
MSTQILMPALSPTMEEGKLAKWLVKEGDTVKSGDILAEIETDKATMEFEAVDEGTIGKILVPEGTEGVKVNAPIATLIGEDGDTGAPPDITSAMASIKDAVHAEAKTPEAPKQAAAPKPEAPAEKGERVFASPLARRIAEQKGIDIAKLAGSGPRGRIVKADVEAAKAPVESAVKAAAAAKAPEAPRAESSPSIAGVAPLPDARAFFKKEDYDEIPHDSMRKAIARRLTSSKTLIPHFYLTVDCRIDNLLATRARLNETAAKGAYKLSVNDFVVKASALALIRVPEVNA